MGGRGSFLNISSNDFTFTEQGQTYHSLGFVDNVEILIRNPGMSVKAPEYSHSPNRVYAIIQNGCLKHLTYYDGNHRQVASIDFLHFHDGLKPHKHLFMDHSTPALPITEEELNLSNKIRRKYNLV